jgi:RNA recognition motif-containing protein
MQEMGIDSKNVKNDDEKEKEVYLGKRDKPDSKIIVDNSTESAGNRLYITNIPYIVEKDVLKQEFEKFGKVTECIIPRDSDYNSKGFAFITFEEEADAAKAIALVDNTVVFGRIIHVKSASKPKRVAYENHGGSIPITEDYAKTSFKKIKKNRFM